MNKTIKGAAIILAICSAVVGWCVIEGAIWIFSNIGVSIAQ